VGTWGSGLLAHPKQPIVVMSFPRDAGPQPWAVIDVAAGNIQTAKGLRGELRDWIATGDEAFCLTTHAVCRLRLTPEPTVLATYRPKGLGTYLWRMLDFGPDFVGVTGWASKTLVVLSRTDGTVVKRIASTAPQSSIRIDDRVIRLFAFHGGEVVDIDLKTLKPIQRHHVPDGTRAVVSDDEVFTLIGPRRAADAHVDVQQIWRIEPKELVALDSSLRVVRRIPAPRGARDVLAITDGVIVIATDRGVALACASDLSPLGELDFERSDVWQHAFVPEDRSVVISLNRFLPTELKVVRWTM
jgi:hypothetical protein